MRRCSERSRADHGLEVPQPPAIDKVFADWEDGKRRGVRGSPEFFVQGRGYFCPTLEITRIGEHVQIVRDLRGFTSFLAACFDE